MQASFYVSVYRAFMCNEEALDIRTINVNCIPKLYFQIVKPKNQTEIIFVVKSEFLFDCR